MPNAKQTDQKACSSAAGIYVAQQRVIEACSLFIGLALETSRFDKGCNTRYPTCHRFEGSGLVLRWLGPGFTVLGLGPGFRPITYYSTLIHSDKFILYLCLGCLLWSEVCSATLMDIPSIKTGQQIYTLYRIKKRELVKKDLQQSETTTKNKQKN